MTQSFGLSPLSPGGMDSKGHFLQDPSSLVPPPHPHPPNVPEVLLLHCWAPQRENVDLAKGVCFLCSSSLTLAGTLGPSCCNVSLTVLPKTKVLPQQQSFPWSLTAQSRPDRPEASAGPAQRICLQPLPSVCQRGNPPSRPFCPSPAFFSCLRTVWVGGWGPRLFPHPAYPPPAPAPGCSSLWPQPCFAPLAPQGQRCPQSPSFLFGWKPALPLPAVGRFAKSWRAGAGGLGLTSPAWH